MRGKVCGNRRKVRLWRITPAYAGKRQGGDATGIDAKDHPRLCGEKVLTTAPLSYTTGSPPPMRGKVESLSIFAVSDRITPAYAGKRRHTSQRSRAAEDHPRLCGEKTKKIPKQRYFFHQPASFSFSLQYT